MEVINVKSVASYVEHMTLAAERAIDFTHSTGEQETAQRAQEWLTKFRAELNQANRKPR